MPEQVKITIQNGDEGQRLDKLLTSKLEELTRSAITRLIKNGSITLTGKKLSSSHKTEVGEVYTITIPEPEPIEAVPEDIPLDIVYEDAHIIIINKVAGMVVHPAKGNFTGTLVNGLLFHCKDLSGIGGKLRPGIVHRLDKDTSGLIAVAKSDLAHNSLCQQLKTREMGREYAAIVKGTFKEEDGKIDAPIGRHPQYRKKMSVRSNVPKDALTIYHVEENYNNSSLLKVNLKTGRTHQIRVHLSSTGHPLIGDKVYGNQKTPLISRPALHAKKIKLVHPESGEPVEFNIEPPEDFMKLVEALRSGVRL